MRREYVGGRILHQIGNGTLLLVIALLLGVSPLVAQAQDASPAPTAEPNALETMLELIPASVTEIDNFEQATIEFADIETQLDAIGVTPPDTVEDAEGFDQWVAATRSMALPLNAAQYLYEWRKDYGFDLLQADRTLSITMPPFALTLFQGRFDPEEVLQQLEEIGYQPSEVDGHTLLSIRGDYETGLDAPTAYKLAGMNYATILDDGTLAFASAGAPLAAVLDVEAGQRASLMDQAGISALVASAPPDLVTAVLVHGAALASGVPVALLETDGSGTPDVDAIATEIAEADSMPPVAIALLGATAGGPLPSDEEQLAPDVPEARAVAVLLMLSPDAAETAAGIIDERLATGTSERYEVPYTELFPEHEVQVSPTTPAVVVELQLGENTPPGILLDLLYSRDLGFLAW